MLKIVPETGEVSTIGKVEHKDGVSGGRYKYGGAVVGDNGALYALPSDAGNGGGW